MAAALVSVAVEAVEEEEAEVTGWLSRKEFWTVYLVAGPMAGVQGAEVAAGLQGSLAGVVGGLVITEALVLTQDVSANLASRASSALKVRFPCSIFKILLNKVL